jgi:hypothetical protein
MIDHIEADCYCCDKELFSSEEIFKTVVDIAEEYCIYDFCSKECFQETIKKEPGEIFCGFKAIGELKKYIDNIPVGIHEAKREYRDLKNQATILTPAGKTRMEKLKSFVVVQTRLHKEYSNYLSNVCFHEKLINTVCLPGGFISGNCEICSTEIKRADQLCLF